MVNGPQIRAARAFLDWQQHELANRAGVARKTITDFERELRTPTPRVVADIVATLEDAGIRFIEEADGKCGIFLDLEAYRITRGRPPQ